MLFLLQLTSFLILLLLLAAAASVVVNLTNDGKREEAHVGSASKEIGLSNCVNGGTAAF